MQYTPLIIIGAPRSGTNMLRDVLTAASIGKGKVILGDEKIQRVLPHIYETQQRLGYA